MGNCVKHIAWYHQSLAHLWGRTISRHRSLWYWSHRVRQGSWSKQCRAILLSRRGEDSASYGNYMCMPRKRMCTVVLGTCINADKEVRAHFHSCFQSHMAQGWGSSEYRGKNPCTALRVGGVTSALFCPWFTARIWCPFESSLLACLLLILLGELAKVEAQDPCPSPAIPYPCIAQPVFPLRYYTALPALLRALPWEGAGKLSCLDRPWLLSQHRFILHLCFYPTLPKYSCS